MRPAGLGAGSRQAFTTKRLGADDGADLVPIDVEVSDSKPVNHLLDPAVDAGMQAKGQPEALLVDVIHHRVDLDGVEPGNVQNRSEDLAVHVLDARHLEDSRRDKPSATRCIQPEKQMSGVFQPFAIGIDVGFGFLVDDGSDVRGDVPGVPSRSSAIAPWSISRTCSFTSFWM